jgi:hypothetical protein
MPGPKTNNRRVYPEANHQPRQLYSFRVADAKERQEAYDKLTLQQKLDKLPPEPQAKKQRARLLSLLEKQNQPKASPTKGETKTVVAEVVTTSKQEQPKKYMKGQKKNENV